MKGDLLERAGEILLEVFELDGEEREVRLRERCGGDAELRAAVERMLARDAIEDDFLGEDELRAGKHLLPITRGESRTSDAWSMPPRIEHYRILRRIGVGGMGAVYLAEQDSPKRRVALKMIQPGLLSSGILRRFRYETELLGRLQHPGIAQIFEAGSIDSRSGPLPYFAMEYVDGAALHEYAERHRLEIPERLELLARICDAIHHAHQKGVVHRDLKPENVLVVEAAPDTDSGVSDRFPRLGQPKILDFGVARATDSDLQVTTMHTAAGQLVGTLHYMSPEQVAGDPDAIDVRSDIYALGVLLYELLAARLPYDFEGKSIPEAARIIREEEPTRLGSIVSACRGDIETIVSKAIDKDPERRYESAAELAGDIRRFLANEPIIARPPSTLYQLRKFARRNKVFVSLMSALFAVLVAGVVTSVILLIRANESATRAQRSEADSRRTSYRLAISAAQVVIGSDPMLAAEHLEEAPEELRGWEWRHLQARIAGCLCTYEDDCEAIPGIRVGRRQDGKLVAALLKRGAVELIDAESGDVLEVLPAGEGVTNLQLSPDASHLMTFAPSSGRLTVMDTLTGEVILTRSLEEGDFGLTRFSPDGSLIALRKSETEWELIHSRGGELLMPCIGTNASRRHAAISHDGSLLVLERFSQGYPFVLTLIPLNGKRVKSKSFDAGCAMLAFSPSDDDLAVACWQKQILILDSATLEVRRRIMEHSAEVTAVAWSTDGARLASSSKDGTTRIWDPASGVCLGIFPGGGATSLAFSRDGMTLATASPGKVEVWSSRNDGRRVLRGHGSYAYTVAISPDGSLIASGDAYNELCLWEALSGELLFRDVVPGCRHALGFDPGGDRLILGFPYSRLGDPESFDAPHILDLGTGQLLEAPRLPDDERLFASTSDEAFSPVLRYARAVAGGEKLLDSFGSDVAATSLDRRLIAHGASRGGLVIRDRETGRELQRIEGEWGHPRALAFDAAGSRLAVGFKDGILRVFSVESGAEQAVMHGHPDLIYAVDFSPDGTRLASGGNDGTIIIWDADTYVEVAVLRDHESYVHALRFSGDGSFLASASGDGTVRMWDVVPPARRHEQVLREKRLRARLAPRVRALLEEMEDPLDVADRLRAELSMSAAERRAALRVLLRTCHQRRR